MANAPQITVSVTPSIVTTTDGVSVETILSVPFHHTTGGQSITFDVVGYDFTNNDIATAKISVKVKNVAGTLTMVGTPVHLVPINAGSSSELVTASLTAVVSGSNVNLNVIGVTGKTIKWVAYANAGIEVLDTWTAVSTPEDGYINTWSASNTRWNPVSSSAAISAATILGDVTGTIGATTVVKLRGATVPASGSLTTGNVLQVSGSSALTYAPVNLNGGTNYVSGALAAEDGYVLTWNNSNARWEAQVTGALAPLSGDVTGNISSSVVIAISGSATTIGGNAADLVTLGDGGASPTHLYLKRPDFSGTTGSHLALKAGANTGANAGGSLYLLHGESASGAKGTVNIGYDPLLLTFASSALMSASGSITLSTYHAAAGGSVSIQADPANGGRINLNPPLSSTVGGAGGASALPATPLGYLTVYLDITGSLGYAAVKIPYYLTA